MELFDPGHFASGLGDLDAVADEDGLEVDAKNAGVESEDQSAPGVGEFVQIQGRAMEEVQEPVVAGRLQAQGAHNAGDPQQVLAYGHSGEAERHPQEGPGAGAGGPQFAHQIPPVIPEHERPPSRVVRGFGFWYLQLSVHSIAYICYTSNTKRRLHAPETNATDRAED